MEDETLPDDCAKPAANAPASTNVAAAPPPADHANSVANSIATRKPEYGGPKGLEPTRYGDWERNGRCYDF